MQDKPPKDPARLTLAELARRVGTSPQNLSKTYIKRGILSVSREATGKPFIELSEALRVFGDRFGRGGVDKDGQPKPHPVDAVDGHVSEVKARLDQALRALEVAKERELWLRAQIDRLSDTVKLLEWPKSAKRGLLARLFM